LPRKDAAIIGNNSIDFQLYWKLWIAARNRHHSDLREPQNQRRMQNLVIRENHCDLAWTQSNMASVTACVVDHFSELAIGNHRVMPARNTQRKGIGLIPALGKDWIDDVQGRILRVLRLARIHQGRRYGLQEWARRQNKDANERLRVRARAGNTLSDQSARSIDGARGRLRRDGPLLEFRRPLAVGARSHASFHAWVSGIGYCGICQCFRGTAGSGRAIGGRCARVPVPSFVAHSSSHISLDSRALKCKALSGNEWRITCRRSY